MQKYYELSRKEWFSQPRIVAGVMTGTSLDGIDTAIARFYNRDNRHSLEVLGTCFEPYSSILRDKISAIIEKKRPISDTAELQMELAFAYSTAIQNMTAKANIPLELIDAVGIHGQTVWHSPPKKNKTGVTLQLANGSALSQMLGITVVSDFRTADVAAGGQGAPLVPIFDAEFFRSSNLSVGLLNIGGISNITFLPPHSSDDPIKAFDTGPGNMLIDAASLQFFGKKFDENGALAKEGTLIPGLLQRCLEHPFILKQPPKSTGREDFGRKFLEQMLGSIRLPATPGEDIIRTMTEFTAESIARNIMRFGSEIQIIIASGGGVNNQTLMQCLALRLGNISLTTSEKYSGISSDFKEAVCFAYLAYRTIGGLPGNIPSVTGASKSCILGSISFPLPFIH